MSTTRLGLPSTLRQRVHCTACLRQSTSNEIQGKSILGCLHTDSTALLARKRWQRIHSNGSIARDSAPHLSNSYWMRPAQFRICATTQFHTKVSQQVICASEFCMVNTHVHTNYYDTLQTHDHGVEGSPSRFAYTHVNIGNAAFATAANGCKCEHKI